MIVFQIAHNLVYHYYIYAIHVSRSCKYISPLQLLSKKIRSLNTVHRSLGLVFSDVLRIVHSGTSDKIGITSSKGSFLGLSDGFEKMFKGASAIP